MSLLGRLEDLSLTDIIQIVFLSRRTGVLEIVDAKGRHTVLFRQGLVVNASSPDHPDLLVWLQGRGLLPGQAAETLRRMEESGIPFGTAALELNILRKEDLGEAIRSRILDVVSPLLQSREGEFNFILSETMSALDIEYEPDQLFREGGFPPQKILGAAEGEKIKPLQGLEESLKAGKALLRGAASDTAPAKLNLGLGGGDAPAAPAPAPVPETPSAPPPAENVVPFPAREEPQTQFSPVPEDTPLGDVAAAIAGAAPPARDAGQFKVTGGLIEVESPEAAYRNVVLFERNPLIRVAAKRAFGKKNAKIFQFGSIDDVREAIADLFRSTSFFVTFLELTENDQGGEGPSVRLLQQIKRKNPRLPVVVIDIEADLRRRHHLLSLGADLYLTRPAPARLQPGMAEEELTLFADELVLFAERAFAQWRQMIGGYGPEAGKKFYELAQKDSLDRSFTVLKQLINELSNPDDIGQVSATILRMSAEYLDRGALFMVADDAFVGLGGFGLTGGGEEMDARIRRVRIARDAPSILGDVAAAREVHRGKMRKTPANVQLIESMGGMLPTEVVAMPIMHGDKTIGILYGDNAENRGPIDGTTGLEIFLSQAGYAFGKAVQARLMSAGR
ncbi:MAG TPA: response regulator [Thermoanaerobaculia bacterium]|nr:response regulator [Thermoanaerobaculia bacterium]